MTDPVLPGVLGEIEEVAGLAAALQVAAAKGGGPAYFPAAGRLTVDHWLVQAVGRDVAVSLCRHFGGQSGRQIKITLGPVGSRAKRWAAMKRAIAAGRSAVEIARTLGIDEKTVRRHRRGESGKSRPKDERQGSFL